MKIRKYTGDNAHDAMQKVKADLGLEALIISTKKVRQKGVLGYFKKPLIEVTAAIDEQAIAKNIADQLKKQESKKKSEAVVVSNEILLQFQQQLQAKRQLEGQASTAQALTLAPETKSIQPQKSVQAQTQAQMQAQALTQAATFPRVKQGFGESGHQGARNTATNRYGVNMYQEAGRASGSPFGEFAAEGALAHPVSDAGGETSRIQDLESKVLQIEDLIRTVYREVSITSKMVLEDENAEKLEPLSNVLKLFYGNMVKNEVEPEFAAAVIERVGEALTREENGGDATNAMYREVFGTLGNPETIDIRSDKKPTVAIFVGPTGVGKTTTLAKIAANYSLNQNLKVGLITADTYRIAAVQQLKTYAEILGMPVSVIYEQKEIQKAIEAFSNKDLVLIDTAGRSHRSKVQFEELKSLVAESRADEVFLVLSATTGIKNNREIIKNYSFLQNYKLIFTKADESPTLGMLLNARMMTDKSLSYITTGQSVPDDIEIANTDAITRNLIGSVSYE